MDSSTIEHLDGWRGKVFAQVDISEIVDVPWLELWVWFWQHSYADFAASELEFDGASFKAKEEVWLLVVTVHQDKVPLVGFFTAADPTGCIRMLRRKLRDGSCNWTKDKYR